MKGSRVSFCLKTRPWGWTRIASHSLFAALAVSFFLIGSVAAQETDASEETQQEDTTDDGADSSGQPISVPAEDPADPEPEPDEAATTRSAEENVPQSPQDEPASEKADTTASQDALAETAESQTPEEDESKEDTADSKLPKWIDVGALMQTVFLWKNDDDFDRTSPIYDEDGQSVGILATIFQPDLTLRIGDRFALHYELELGLNMWSKNNPDQYDPTSDDTFFLKHREMWASGSFLGDNLGFKVGYQHFEDPTGLFLNHWTGVASLYFFNHKNEHIWLSFGQVPDSTYEGFVITENNFAHDTFFVGAYRRNPIADTLFLNTGVFVLVDNHVVDRQVVLGVPSLGVEIPFDAHSISIDGLLQAGQSDFSIAGEDVTHLAYSIEAHGAFDFEHVGLDVNLLYLSADDASYRNDRQGSPLYSGKNRSATILLTENELRDFGDNYDERMGTKDGGFYNLRSGLMVVDARVEGRIGPYFRPAFIAGLGLAPESDNALGEIIAGGEFNLDICFVWRDVLSWHLLGGLFVPGGAAAALINNINTSSTDNVYTVQSSLSVSY